MAASPLRFRFTSSLARVEAGMTFHVLPVPDNYAARWRRARVRRLVGTINGHPVNRALKNHADGGSFLIVGRDLMKAAGIGFRAPARLDLQPDPAPDRLDLPEEFRIALAQDEGARARWETFTRGFQRSLLSYVASAKTEPTRIKRALDLAAKIRTRTLYGDVRKRTLPGG
jgi:hypothetical protein